MSLFYEPLLSTKVAFAVNSDATDASSDLAVLGKRLWEGFAESHTNLDRICLSISPLGRKSPKSRGLQALSCWAILGEEVDDGVLVIPLAWLLRYPNVFCQKDILSPQTISIAVVEPVLLTEVVVTMVCESAQNGPADSSILQNWIRNTCPILRCGDVRTITNDQSNFPGLVPLVEPLRYRFDMLEPVMQGYAEERSTKLIIMTSTALEDDLVPTEEPDKEQDGIEIDEAFLGISIVPQSFRRRDLDGTKNEINGLKPFISEDFGVETLSSPVSLIDDHCTLYLRTADLTRIGLLNGDWAVANSHSTSNYRLVHIFAKDDLVLKSGSLIGSPVLLHNFASDGVASGPPNAISLFPSPFGSCQPTIPVARSVTIARVASSTSIKSYQELSLNLLKSYFEDRKRLVKRGDIIALPFDADASRSMQISHSNLDAPYPDHFWQPLRANEIAYFIITSIDYSVLENSSSAQDTYVGSTVGELGCWVDPVITRVIQTGMEHSRIPKLGTYLQLDQFHPSALLAAFQNRGLFNLLGPQSCFEKVLSLCSATLAHQAFDYELYFSLLLKGPRGAGKFTCASWVAQNLGFHLIELDCYDAIGDTDVESSATIRARFEQAQACSPCILVLRHIDALSQSTQVAEIGKDSSLTSVLLDCIEDTRQSWKITGYPVVILGTTGETSLVSKALLSCFKHEVALEAPNEAERLEILDCLLLNTSLAPDVSLTSLATQTAAFVAKDLVNLISRAQIAAIQRAIGVTIFKAVDSLKAGITLASVDFEYALDKARASYSESIGAPKIPSVSWDDVGGLAHVKSDILDTIQLPLDHPELFSDGLKKRSGILLYGPPGTGKTLVAKAVATSCSLNFFSVKGPELLNMYIGESEANVRRVFQRARDAKPCVIFFDELDSVAPKRGNHGDSGGVMDRIVSQLLAELDGMAGGSAGADVFVIGATNRPDLLDPALLRPGRFDRMLYLGVSHTHEAQANILEALTRKFRLDPTLDLRQIAVMCPLNYTGADFYALCSDAMLNAMSRKAEEIERKIDALKSLSRPHHYPYPLTAQYFLAELAELDDIIVFVSQRDFENALRTLVPSVSQAEMEHYARVQRRFSGAHLLFGQ